MAFILPIEEPWTSQPQEVVGLDWSNPIAKRLIGGCVAGANISIRPGVVSTVGKTATPSGMASSGGSGSYVTCPYQKGQIGRTNGGTTETAHHTVVFLAHNVGNGFIYDCQSDGFSSSALDIKVVAGNYHQWASGVDMFSGVSATVPSSGRVFIAAYSGQQSGAQPEVTINKTKYTGSNASQDSWSTMRYGCFFGSSAYPASNIFVGAGVVALVFSGKLSDGEIASMYASPWQIFAP